MALWTLTPITVDGVSLDTYAWNIEDKVRRIPAVRVPDEYFLPGIDGDPFLPNQDYEPGLLTLSMWVRGTDTNGVVPASSVAQVRRNMDALSFLFSKRYGLLDVREDIPELGTRQMMCTVLEMIEPTVTPGNVAQFKVLLKIPDVFSQDVAMSNWSQVAVVPGNSYEVTSLQGSTGPIADAVFTFTGPATNPQLTDLATGAYVRLNAALAAGQVWRVSSETWSTRYGTGLTFASADTAGTDAQSVTVFGGGTSRFLRLQPQLSAGACRVSVTVGGSGFTSATSVGVRGRRKYLQ